ncbi:MAG: hypothetical protein APF78_01150 [Sphingomonadales bacterium BRH_c3]|nr:MAG: hypothetical protein APF78_01150 [Sphingomonadales bacterium BRH_c3]
MDSDDLEEEPRPDLAQLLVLEAGRILEDLTPELAVRLPTDRDERLATIASALAALDDGRALMVAATRC